MKSLEIGTWYLDIDTTQLFKVLAIERDTVQVVDDAGNRRVLNRSICETSFSKKEGA